MTHHHIMRRLRRNFSSRAAAVLAVSLATGLAAGCSSGGSSSGSSPGSTTGAASAASNLKGSPIPVGAVGSYSGPQASSEGGSKATIQAWADWVNANGGINGHPVKLYVLDDASDSTTALQDVKELVQQDHVVAIVGEESNVDVSWASYIASTGVPVVGGLPLNLTFSTNPDFFASGTSGLAQVYGTLAEAKNHGGKVAVLYCAESPQCASGVPLDYALSKAAGVKLVYVTKVSGTQTSYAAPCLGAKGAGATAVWIAEGSAVVKTIADACLQQGVKLAQVASDGSIAQNWLPDPAFNGATVTELDLPYFVTSTPAGAQYRAALKKYAPSIYGTNLDGPNDTYAWAGGLLFLAAAKAAHLGDNATPAEVKQGLYTLHNETLGGFSPPLTFTQGKPDAVNCYFTFGITGGKETLPNGTNLSCAPMPAIDAILAALK